MVLLKKNITPARNAQTKRKAFEVDNGNDSEFEDNSDEEMPAQKTPQNKRPKGKQSTSKKKMSFELLGKKTPARTLQKNNSFLVKKQLTPAGKGKTVQEFKGNKALQVGDREEDDGSEVDIDDISEDDDDSNDDIGMDDDGSDDMDDDNNGMDEDDDEEEQEQMPKPKKSNPNQQKNYMNEIKKTHVKEIDAKSLVVGNLPKDVTTDELKALSPDIVKVTKKIGYAYLSFASEDKVDTNYEALQGKELRGRTIRIDYVGEKSKSHENGAKSLFVGNLPKDVTTDELKALSPDIVNVIKNIRSAYISFASEDKVDINYEALKGKELRGRLIRIDYVGEKRKIFFGDIPNLRTLAVDGIPLDASIADVAAHFSTAQQIRYNRSTLRRRAIITFQDEKCANEAFNSKIEIQGQTLRIKRILLNNSEQSWRKNSGYQGGSPGHTFPRFSRKMSHNSGSRRGNPARSFPRYSRKMSHNSGCRRGNSAKKM